MTIYALSTPPGRGAIAIIRLSGGHTQKVVEKLPAKLRQSRVWRR